LQVLVTGATGFIGQWLLKKLLAEGHRVRVLARNPTKDQFLQQLPVEIVKGDVTSLASMVSALNDCHSVFHLAGLIGYKSSDRLQMENINVGGTKNVLEACLKQKTQRLVHMSSVVTIGATLNQNVLNEESPYSFSNFDFGYPETKRKAEELVLEYAKNRGLHAVILNPSTVYGPGDAQKGSRSTQVKVAKGSFPFYTNGGVSITDVNSVVEATYFAWLNSPSGERYVLSGDNITIHELFRTIAASAGVMPPSFKLPNFIVQSLGRLGDFQERRGKKFPISSESAFLSTMYHWYDHTKATEKLNYHPLDYRTTIKSSVDWMKQHGII